MFFKYLPFIRGTVQSLESLRSTFIGALAMSIFIKCSIDELDKINDDIELMDILNITGALLIPKLSITTPFLIGAYIDQKRAVE